MEKPKKFFSLLLAISMILSMSVPAFAADVVEDVPGVLTVETAEQPELKPSVIT